MTYQEAMNQVLTELTTEYERVLIDLQKRFDTFEIWQFEYKRSKALYQDLLVICRFVDRVKQTMENNT